MIIYFSSTGNCKHISERLAREFNDTAESILNIKHIHLKSKEKLGFVFPTYFWRLPSVVTDYMKNVVITSEDKKPYIYFIATYGSTCGQTGSFMKKHLGAKGFELALSLGIKTVDDWTVWFNANNKSEIEYILQDEQNQLSQIINLIKDDTHGNKMKNTLPMLAVIGSDFFYGMARRTKHLRVEDSCIGCGLCKKECPTSSIEIKDGKPVWINDKCAMCLHCLHACPKFAIQYDDKTKNHGQYMHP